MQFFLVAATVGVGMTSSLQIALLGAIQRQRGTFEASWISMLASLGGMGLVLLTAVLSGSNLRLPRPFTSAWAYFVMSALMLGALVLAAKGLPAYLAATGFLPIPYLLAAASIGPRIGLGVYLAAIIAGQLIGAVGLDHVGAFGAVPRAMDPLRAVGIASLILGVALIHGGR